MKHAALIVVLWCLPACSQVLEITGGQSSLLNSAGVGVTSYFANSTATLGAGIVNGHLAFGASDTFPFRGYQVTAGDAAFGFGVQGVGGLGIVSRGLTITRQSPTTTSSAFVGATGLGYTLPFFSALQPAHAGAGLYWQHRAGQFQFAGLSAFSGNQKTAAASIGGVWRQFQFAVAGGLLAGQRTATGQATYSPSRAFSITAMRQDLFWNNQRAAVNSVSAFSSLGRLNLHGAAIDSKSNIRILAQSAGGSLRFGFATLGSDFYQSNGQRLWMQSAHEDFRHWNFSQSFSSSGALHSFGFGGGFHNNHFAFSVGHAVQFLPFGRGFQNVTQVSIGFKLPHSDTHISLQVSMLPTGPAYTVGGNTFVNGPLKTEPGQHEQHAAHRNSAGRYVITGTVLDKSGLPVDGAAVALGSQVVYADHAGRFVARFRNVKPVAVQVRPDEFAAPGNWAVVSAPMFVQPGSNFQIVVGRQP